MRRNTSYEVASGREFTPSEWDFLASCVQTLGSGFAPPTEYRHSEKSGHWRSIGKLETFSVWRADGKALTIPERNAFYWFFLGVMEGAGIGTPEPEPKPEVRTEPEEKPEPLTFQGHEKSGETYKSPQDRCPVCGKGSYLCTPSGEWSEVTCTDCGYIWQEPIA